MIRVDGVTTVDDEDPIVWERYAERPSPVGLRFRHIFLKRSDWDRLLSHLGEDGLKLYLKAHEEEVRLWGTH